MQQSFKLAAAAALCATNQIVADFLKKKSTIEHHCFDEAIDNETTSEIESK